MPKADGDDQISGHERTFDPRAKQNQPLTLVK
jgi:hypothetical protein